ncbi:MAG: hypothetical protein ABJK39_01300 [Hyphomicrobiales bacterium]
MTFVKALFLSMLITSTANAEEFRDFSRSQPNCETFTVGATGHSDYCKGPHGYGLVLHYRRARIDLEIVRPDKKRGSKVHRLVDYLGDGQRTFSGDTIRWHIVDGRAVAFAMNFEVEPQAYEQFIPLSLIFRVDEGDGANDCPIATIGQGSKLQADKIMMAYAERRCRPVFPKQ